MYVSLQVMSDLNDSMQVIASRSRIIPASIQATVIPSLELFFIDKTFRDAPLSTDMSELFPAKSSRYGEVLRQVPIPISVLFSPHVLNAD